MKKIIFFTFTFIIFHLTFNICNCFSQWQPDVRLTNDTGSSFASHIATNGNVMHVVWYDTQDGNQEIYYKRSTDGGVSWGADTRLTNNPADSRYPTVSISGQVVHVVWHDNRDSGNWLQIYYKRSTDGGVNWEADTRLSIGDRNSYYPSVSVSGQVVHIVWMDSRDLNTEIYYKRSTDGGVNWEADTRLTNNSASSYYPSVSVSGQIVHVVWHDNRDGNHEIYYKRSTDGGVSWGTDARLTNNPAISQYPSIAVSGSVVHVVWTDYRDGAYEIYYKFSIDAGINWDVDTRLTNAPSYSMRPSIAVSDSNVHNVWYDNRDGNYEIYYKRSTNGGITWGADTRLTNNTGTSYSPSLSVSGQTLHVVWYDNRDGNYEIYYKCNPTGNLTGIVQTNPEIPKEYKLMQNYPNPFNPVTKISFNIPKQEFVSLKIFDALGREVATLVNESLTPGTYEVTFDALGYSSGVYFYRIAIHSDKLITDGFTDTKKMLMIK